MTKFDELIESKKRIKELDAEILKCINTFSDRNPKLKIEEMSEVILRILIDINKKALRNSFD